MNYYNLLGVNPSSTKEEISSEYNYLINLICPYVDESSVLARIFIDINSSYEILSCESSKLEYNSKLSHQDIFDIENNYRKYLNTKYMFLNLNKALNQMINVTYIESGSIKTIKGYLDAVHAFNNIMLMDGKVI